MREGANASCQHTGKGDGRQVPKDGEDQSYYDIHKDNGCEGFPGAVRLSLPHFFCHNGIASRGQHNGDAQHDVDYRVDDIDR